MLFSAGGGIQGGMRPSRYPARRAGLVMPPCALHARLVLVRCSGSYGFPCRTATQDPKTYMHDIKDVKDFIERGDRRYRWNPLPLETGLGVQI